MGARFIGIGLQEVRYPSVQPAQFFLEFFNSCMVRFCSHVARQFIQIIQGKAIIRPLARGTLFLIITLPARTPRIRRTDVRPIASPRAISALLMPARCSLRNLDSVGGSRSRAAETCSVLPGVF